jgi:hypothetical protein
MQSDRTNGGKIMNMPTRETSTILAALRYWQAANNPKHSPVMVAAGNEFPECQKIAGDRGSFKPLDAAEIDELCEHINLCVEPEESATKLLSDLAEAVRDLKLFGGNGGTLAEETAREALEAAEKAKKMKMPSDPVALETDEKYREFARTLGSSNNEDIQIDADAKVSHGSEAGAYVAAWVWVTEQQAGIERPKSC